ncbi:MAG: PIN domain-containing protein [Treponema sp.]|nr:PIN domain-containing protein [Treponema sp.]
MSVYTLDSNIISFYLRGNTAVIENIEKAINEDHTVVISPIVYYEVKRGLLLINATKQLQKFADLCNLFPVGEFGDYLLESAIEIYVQERKEKRNIEDADVFIAAFCLHNNYILVTDNAKHFKNIQGLHTVNWRYTQT